MRIALPVSTAIVTLCTAGTAAAQLTGPSTSTEPYVLPARPGVATVSLLTVGDSVGGYRLAGIPDGGGAWDEDGDTFNWVIHHEIEKAKGVVRAHGATGAFVSRWLVDRRSFAVLDGRDHMTTPANIHTWNGTGYTAGAHAIDRLCSGDLAPKNGLFVNGRLGTAHRVYLSGEENTPPYVADQGRMFAHLVTGPDKNDTYELPRLGKMAFENALASPYQQPKTVVMLTDDASRETTQTLTTYCRLLGQTGCFDPPSQMFMYVGDKQTSGKDIDKAGLTSGRFYGLRVVVDGVAVPGEHPANIFGSVGYLPAARFELVPLGDDGDATSWTGMELEDQAVTAQVTQFIRPEDGAWDPRPGHERDFYFLTTGRITTSATTWRPSRLWRVRFDDITQPELGGTIEAVISSTFDADNVNDPGFQMGDNMAIDVLGRVIIQEDVGNTQRLGRVWAYGLDSGALVRVAAHNPAFFSGSAATNPTFLTADEESSGVIDASHLFGNGWYLLVSQSHRASADPELVEGGQMLAMFIDPSIAR